MVLFPNSVQAKNYSVLLFSAVHAVLIHNTIPLELHREQQLPLRRQPGKKAKGFNDFIVFFIESFAADSVLQF
jgi:hypothetical protein